MADEAEAPKTPSGRPPELERQQTPATPVKAASGQVQYDPWRDRIRVALDRVIYCLAVYALWRLQLVGKLDVGSGAVILMAAGIRPHNLFEAVSTARGGDSKAAMMLLLPPMAEVLKNGNWLAR